MFNFERQLLANRNLLFSLVLRDLKLRYAGTTLGIVWAVLQPLIILCMYVLVFSTIFAGGRLGNYNQDIPFGVFLCPCLLAWNWLSETVSTSCGCVVSNASLIKKSSFPCAVLPLVPLLAGLVPFLAVFFLFFIYQYSTGTFAAIEVVLILPVFVTQMFFMSGFALLVSAINVAIRDTSQIVASMLQVLFWATPIVYVREQVVEKYLWLDYWYAANPLTLLMAVWRDAVINHRISSPQLFVPLLLWSLAIYVVGRFVFTRSSRRFVELI